SGASPSSATTPRSAGSRRASSPRSTSWTATARSSPASRRRRRDLAYAHPLVAALDGAGVAQHHDAALERHEVRRHAGARGRRLWGRPAAGIERLADLRPFAAVRALREVAIEL